MPFLLFVFCSLSTRPSSLHTVTDQSHFPARTAQRIFLFLDVGARKLKSKHAGRCLKNVGWQLITMTTRIPEDCSCLVRPRRRVPQGRSFHPPPQPPPSLSRPSAGRFRHGDHRPPPFLRNGKEVSSLPIRLSIFGKGRIKQIRGDLRPRPYKRTPTAPVPTSQSAPDDHNSYGHSARTEDRTTSYSW